MSKTGVRIGSLATDDLTGMQTCECLASVNNFNTFNSPRGVFYQVPVGKKFIISNVLYQGNAANLTFIIGYGDNTKDNDAAAPTNWKQQTGVITGLLAGEQYSEALYIEVPAEKYPAIQSKSAAIFATFFGKEVDA